MAASLGTWEVINSNDSRKMALREEEKIQDLTDFGRGGGRHLRQPHVGWGKSSQLSYAPLRFIHLIHERIGREGASLVSRSIDRKGTRVHERIGREGASLVSRSIDRKGTRVVVEFHWGFSSPGRISSPKRCARELAANTIKLLGASSFAFHPTMEWIFVGDRRGTLLSWDISTERPNMIGM
ncbi:hypothetical protein KSP40_PGU016325 [Platanthera guangdongensis]|uniref:Uncharacterized protein n=1 Tax=Platanthera guangdongensis TaxID=2320717 RepID=A0ABR2LRD6_9ASPA